VGVQHFFARELRDDFVGSGHPDLLHLQGLAGLEQLDQQAPGHLPLEHFLHFLHRHL